MSAETEATRLVGALRDRTAAPAAPQTAPQPHPIAVAFKVNVVGISFADTYPENVFALERMLYEGWGWTEEEPLTALLVREPDNEHDPNAIAVHVPGLGEHAHLGHVPRNVAARLAPQLDAGEHWQAGISAVRVHPDHPLNPGVTLVCTPPAS